MLALGTYISFLLLIDTSWLEVFPSSVGRKSAIGLTRLSVSRAEFLLKALGENSLSAYVVVGCIPFLVVVGLISCSLAGCQW